MKREEKAERWIFVIKLVVLKLESHVQMRQKEMPFSMKNIYQGRLARLGSKGVNDKVRMVCPKRTQYSLIWTQPPALGPGGSRKQL